MAGLIVEGTFYLNRDIDGVKQGIKQIPGLTKFELAPESEVKEQKTKDKGKYGQLVASVGLPSKTGLKVTISDITGEALAFALMGTLTALSVGGGSVTDEDITSKLGSYIELANKNITAASVVVTSNPAGTTYTEGTDYTVNYSLGLIEFLTAGSIPDATSVLVDYDHGAIAGNKIEGSTSYEVRGELMLDGRNLATGKAMQVFVDEALLVTDGSVDLMSDDFVELSMDGRMITQSGKTSPYEVRHEVTES